MADLADLIAGHYERHARQWEADRRLGGWSEKHWHDRFIAELPSKARVLDLGCGGGDPVALNMVARGLQVTGVDTSPTLISLCRERMPDQQWIVADMRSLALEEKFDGVLAWDSFFHLRPADQRRMFDVFAQHSARPAILMFNAGPAHGEAIGGYRGDPLYHASLDPTEYQAQIERIGFEIIAHHVDDDAAGGRTAWLARSRCPSPN
jgi:SAM-dependent methyltransferase